MRPSAIRRARSITDTGEIILEADSEEREAQDSHMEMATAVEEARMKVDITNAVAIKVVPTIEEEVQAGEVTTPPTKQAPRLSSKSLSLKHEVAEEDTREAAIISLTPPHLTARRTAGIITSIQSIGVAGAVAEATKTTGETSTAMRAAAASGTTRRTITMGTREAAAVEEPSLLSLLKMRKPTRLPPRLLTSSRSEELT